MARSAHAVRNGLVALGAACALLLAGGGAADAADEQDGDWMRVTTVRGEEPFGSESSALIRCPGGGGHPRNAEACAALAKVDGDIGQIRRSDVLCPWTYEPVTAIAHGRWQGRRVAYAKAFPNSCVLHASTGPVFELGQ